MIILLLLLLLLLLLQLLLISIIIIIIIIIVTRFTGVKRGYLMPPQGTADGCAQRRMLSSQRVASVQRFAAEVFYVLFLSSSPPATLRGCGPLPRSHHGQHIWPVPRQLCITRTVVCVCVCVCVCMCVIYIYIYTHIYIHTFICMLRCV